MMNEEQPHALATMRRLLRRFWTWLLEPMPFPRDHWYGNSSLKAGARMQEDSSMKRGCDFRNPPFKSRVLVVAIVVAAPGTLAGGILSLVLGEFVICSIVGALV
jgi:hypothetical protein